ncbi:MAG TPA: DUF4349 domain-containing protein [Longimicrobiaceae bacterium]|nr:DUF4349 domain-containing protein [Longimicrobiaceae bacterium]
MISVRIARALLLAVLALAACSRAPSRTASTEAMVDLSDIPAASPAPAPPEAQRAAGFASLGAQEIDGSVEAAPVAGAQPMLIRTGSASVQVDSLDRAVAAVRRAAARVGGYVASSTVQGGGEQAREASLEVKVPSARWDAALAALAPLGKVETVSVTAQDVGEEFVDVTARVENARRLESRLLVLLDQRTGKLDEVLNVERELARVRGEIERFEGRLRYLTTRTAMSTLTVRLHEPRPIVGDYPGASLLGGAAQDAWRNFMLFIAGLIASLGFLVPVAVLGFVAYRIGRRVWRARPESSGPTRLGIRRRPRRPSLKVEQ